MTEKRKKRQIEKKKSDKSATILGFAPITKPSIETAMNNMTKRGVFTPNETFDQCRQRTIKSMIKSWARRNLAVSDEEWDSIKIREITPTAGNDADIIFIKFESTEDVARLTSKAKNISKSN